MDGRPVETLTADLPANGSVTVDFAAVTLTDVRVPGSVRVEADTLPADDVFYFVISPGQVVRVLVVGSERATPEADLYSDACAGDRLRAGLRRPHDDARGVRGRPISPTGRWWS